jgi:succinylglutamate desuccinylase
MMSRVKELLAEWKARRAGRRHVNSDVYRRTRDITGATGFVTSRAWAHAEESGEAYIQSFDEGRLPPSLHISARDQIRAGKAMPLAERCIEDLANPDATEPRPWSMKELNDS